MYVTDMRDKVEGTLFGAAIGDALGVPVEFMDRRTLKDSPITGLTGYGVHGQPPGTFSDDASLTFCLAEALTHEFTLERVATRFIAWLDDAYWTAGGKVFDVGGATFKAIRNLNKGMVPESAGGKDEYDNGNADRL